MRHVSLQLPSEMKLINEGMSKSKAYQVSIISILATIMFLMKSLCFFLPIPVGLFALYFFRNFGEVVAKALYLKNVMLFLVVLMFYAEIFSIMFVGVLAVSDAVMGKVAVQGGFNFSNFGVFKMSVISQIPVAFPFIIIAAPAMITIIDTMAVLSMIYCIAAAIAATGFACIITGFFTLLSFKVIVRIVNRIPNMINVSKEHVGF